MASQIATDPRGIPATPVAAVVQTLPAPGETAGLDHTRQQEETAAPAAAREASVAQGAQTSVASAVSRTSIVVASATVVATAALVTAGLMRRRAMPALRDLAVNALEIRVPVLFPVAIAAIAREFIMYRRAMSPADGADPPAR